jgi:hypothetical protein
MPSRPTTPRASRRSVGRAVVDDDHLLVEVERLDALEHLRDRRASLYAGTMNETRAGGSRLRRRARAIGSHTSAATAPRMSRSALRRAVALRWFRTDVFTTAPA